MEGIGVLGVIVDSVKAKERRPERQKRFQNEYENDVREIEGMIDGRIEYGKEAR
jgi:hypothetical protein